MRLRCFFPAGITRLDRLEVVTQATFMCQESKYPFLSVDDHD
jgi:hypothetical protein